MEVTRTASPCLGLPTLCLVLLLGCGGQEGATVPHSTDAAELELGPIEPPRPREEGRPVARAETTFDGAEPPAESSDVEEGEARIDIDPGTGAYPPQLPEGAPPPLQGVAHHIVVIADLSSWNSVRTLSEQRPNVLVTSQNKPADLPWGRWAQNVSVTWYATGEEMADDVADILTDPAGAPARVMVDELRSGEVEKIAAFAQRMRDTYTELVGRWGVYVVHGVNVAYTNLQPAIDHLLLAHASIVPEMYPARSQYCAAGSTIAERDVWLGDYFRGSRGAFPQARLHWLVSRRTHLASQSAISPIFGVTDTFMDGSRPAYFLDRMFYVWATRSGYRALLLQGNGGPGAYKWEHPHTSNTSRDLAFTESYEHYSVSGSTASRLGPVSCD